MSLDGKIYQVEHKMNTEKRQMLAVSATAEDREQLEKLAAKFGYRHGDRPNVSALIRAIASGEIILTPLASITSHRAVRRPLHRQRQKSLRKRRSSR